MEDLLSRLALRAIDAIWPRFCLRCGREGDLLCGICQEAYRPRISFAACPFCGRGGTGRTCPDCGQQTYLDGLVSLANYGDPVVRKAIGLWKYHGDVAAQDLIANWLRQLIKPWPELIGATMSFVPLHESKRRARGFDQAEELSKMAAQILNQPWQPVLIRQTKTKPQAQVANEQRLVGDMDGIFAVRPGLPDKIILCDDVFTSGATMDAAAKELKEKGAKEAFGLVLAKGSLKT